MPQTNSSLKLSLEQQIAISRRRQQDLYDSRGATDAEVLAAGAELDELLNLYQRLKTTK